MKLIEPNYFLGTLVISFLFIYLLNPEPKIIFKLNNSQINLEEIKCNK